MKWWRTRSIKNRRISVISNNCWGGFMYQSCETAYNTPFIGLFMVAPEYIKLLENIEDVIYRPLVFITRADSKYKDYLKEDWIIGVFEGTDIEIVFMHYHSEEEVLQKWSRRLKRLDLDNMIVKFSDNDLCTDELVRRFDALPFPHKVCFSAKPFPDCKSVIYMPMFAEAGRVGYEWRYSYRYYNFVKEANAVGKSARR